MVGGARILEKKDYDIILNWGGGVDRYDTCEETMELFAQNA